MGLDVYLRFDDRLSDDDREDFLRRLRAVNAPDFEVVDDDQARLSIDSADENAALVRAQVVVQGLCEGTNIDPTLIRRSLESRSI